MERKQLLKHITKSIFVLSLLCVSYYSFTNGGGAPAGNTNAPGDGNCTGCHGGSLISSGTNWDNLTITTNVPANGYVPGTTYNITVSHTVPSINKWGFQFLALNASTFGQAGSLTAGTGMQSSLSGGKTYLTHNSAGTAGTGSKSWSFTWTAPNPGVGTVNFYSIVNAANGDNNTTGDQIYAKTLSISEFSNLPTAVIGGIPPSGNICLGDTLSLQGSGINSPTTFAWTFSGISNPSLQAQQNPKVVFTSVGQKTITLRTTNAFGQSTITSAVVLVINRPPAPISPSGAVSICGSDSVILSTDFNPLLTYSWSPGNQTTPTIKTVTPGVYKVKVTNTSTGCSATSSIATLTAAPKPVPVLTVSKDTICVLDSLTLSSSTPFANYKFLENNTVRYTGNLSSYKGTFSSGSRSIGLVVSDGGCLSDTIRKTVFVQPLLPAPALACGAKSTSSVSFDWAAVAGATGYEVSTDTGKTWMSPNGTLSHTVSGLSPNSNAQLWVRAIDPSLCGKGNIGTLVCTNGACNPISYNISFNKTACLISAADVGVANISITNISSSKVGISFENGPYGTQATHSALAFIGVNTYAIKIIDSNNVGCPRVDTTIQVTGLNPISKQPLIGILGTLCTSDSSMHTVGVFNANSEAEYFLLFKNIDTMPFAKLNRNMSDTLTFSKISKLSALKSGDIIRAVAVDTATLCSKPSPSIPIMVFTSPKAGFTTAINELTVSFTDTTFQTSKRDWMFMGAIPDVLNGAVTISKTFPSAGKKKVMMKVTDVNGCEEKASAEITLNNVGLDELTQVMPLSIYPNPVGSELYYTLAGSEDAHVMIYDMKGKLVKQQVVKDAENRVDVQMLTPGLYMIYLSQSNNNYFTRFMKE